VPNIKLSNSTEAQQPRDFSVVTINYSADDAIQIPEGMNLSTAVEVLQRRMRYESEETVMAETFDVHPYDGAHALFEVLKNRFGWAEMQVREPKSFFDRRQPPTMLNVQTGYKQVTSIPWGTYRLPGGRMDGQLETGMVKKQGRLVFSVQATIFRRDEPFVARIFADVRRYLDEGGSIYQGKAVSLRFRDEAGDLLPLPEPEFMDTNVDESMLAFPEDTWEAINTSLFTPLRRLDDLRANHIPIKRGVLLGGPYGTGKTLTAKVASKLATQNGITFIYAREADELATVIQFAKLYANPAVVVFCEDIDSVMTGKREKAVNTILNIIDGVDTKGLNLITLLTTNHTDQITQALLRPGRLDAVITVPPPDAKTVERLLRIYGGDLIPENSSLEKVSRELDGAIPAVIAEVVRRAKLHQIARQNPGEPLKQLSPEALLASAVTIRAQRELLKKREVSEKVETGLVVK
jgi:transitional endoplasmic reticulum ATPase